MKTRTLVTRRRYFGVEALALREAAARVMGRVAGLPAERSRVHRRHLRQDFNVDTVEGAALVNRLVAGGLLQPFPDLQDDFQVTPRLAEFAAARVVEPLARAKARRLVDQAGRVAEKINADHSRNPLAVVAIAPLGSYLSHEDHLAELRLGVVLGPRPVGRRSRWRAPVADAEGRTEIRRAFEAMSSFVVVTLTDDRSALPRPFAITWHDSALG
jgi:hypothetical protein